MFGGVNVWRIVEAKEIGEIKFGELIDFIHRDAIYMLNFGWLKFGEPWTARQIRQTFPLYGTYATTVCYSEFIALENQVLLLCQEQCHHFV